MRTFGKALGAFIAACALSALPTTAFASNATGQAGSGNVAIGQGSRADNGGVSSNYANVTSVTAADSNVGNTLDLWPGAVLVVPTAH
ncbi:hypothetical protein ACIA8O_31460 [Kitasatospora sp. NPDC051853]|uniref:hypothetical protein n=1 Tax=Kitasatospora sp. NPDC051853 TaxID=3364058 RepID=UPI00378C179F